VSRPRSTIFSQGQYRPVQLSEGEIDEILELCQGSLRSGRLTSGPLIEEFERSFAAESRMSHAVAVSSGTDALEATLRALDVAGRKVLVPTNTFAATAFAALRAGAELVLVDIDPASLAPSPAQVERALGRVGDIAAFVVVHIGGFIGGEIKELATLCRRHGVAMVEDAAHAHGSLYAGESPGTWSVAAAYSFFATKVMTSAEGGLVVTNDEAVASFVRSYRDQGRDPNDPLINVSLGTNARMSELHAALGLIELRHLPSVLKARRQVAEWYDRALDGLPGAAKLPPVKGCEPNYYKYIVLLDSAEMRSPLREFARSAGLSLPSGVYDVPLHRQPAFRHVDPAESFPFADDFCSRHVALPVGRAMRKSDVEEVCSVLRDFLSDRSQWRRR
jgi:perosamine synthetase